MIGIELVTYGCDDSQSQKKSFREIPFDVSDVTDVAVVGRFKNWKIDARLAEKVQPDSVSRLLVGQIPANFE